MHSSTALLLLSAASMVYAQGLSGLPTCAQGCIGNSLSSTGCGMLDVKCICNSSGYISNLSCCISSACQPEDIQKTINFADQLCDSVGVTNLPTSASCASSAASSTMAPTSSGTGAVGGAMGTSSMMSSMMSSMPSGTATTGSAGMAATSSAAESAGSMTSSAGESATSAASGAAGMASSVASAASSGTAAATGNVAPRDFVGMAALGMAGVAGVGAALL